MGTGGGNVPLIICRATAQGHAESCEDLAPTVTAAAGMSGNNQPIVTVPVSAAFMRNPSGDAGGIGYEEEVSPTLLADRPPGVVCPVGFSQKSYDEYENDGVAPTLKAKGGSYGGDGTVDLAIAVDLYNGEITGRRTMTLTAAKNDPHHVPCSLIPYTLKIRGGCDGGGRAH